MIKNDIYNSYKFYLWCKGLGSISIFQSFLVNLDKIKQLNDIFDIGSHTKQKETFIKYIKWIIANLKKNIFF